ncbi:MAG: hypothetical protein GVY20_07065 [Bacteroidetes bacterium]|jgi:hypothetical protein|nr:hypothetical protein [Bacteroidota bacterium]
MMTFKNKLNLSFAILLFIGLTGISCEGPEGPMGPQGEQGPEGPQGEEGTANVIYSDWMPPNWNYRDDEDDKVMYIEESRVTGDFMNTGTLLVYFRSPASGFVQLLPYANYTISIRPFIIDREINGIEYEGIMIQAEQRDGTINPPPLPAWVENIQIRYVMVPDGIPAKMPPGFFEDYTNAKEYFGFTQ